MSVFTAKELEYLAGQQLGRLATVGADGHPHVVPVTFRYSPETDTIAIGGRRMPTTRKWRDAGLHPRVSFVVDDMTSPAEAHMIEIRADAELLDAGGEQLIAGFAPQFMRLRPVRIIAFGIDPEGWTSRKIG